MRLSTVPAAFLSICLLAAPALADNVSGTFKAVSACDAYKSFVKGSNPGLVHTVPGAEYEAVEINDKDISWVRIRIPNIADPLRWVAGECGTKEFGPQAPPAAETEVLGKGRGNCRTKNQYDSYVLAMSWQPAFCDYVAKPGSKPECDALAKGDLVIDHLTLHGLWPNKKSCGTNYGNCGGPALNLDDTTRSRLSPWMPNCYYDTDLATHEWDKHGTCQELPDDQYFLRAMKLVKTVDESSAGTLIKSRSGGSFTVQEFFNQVATDYGQDVADRITLICTHGKYLQEVRINLPRAISDSSDLKQIVTRDAPKADSQTVQCSDPIFIEASSTAVK